MPFTPPELFHHRVNGYDAHPCADGNGYVPWLHVYADVYERIDL